MGEAQRRLAFMESHKEIIHARLQKYLSENPDVDDVPAEVVRQIIEECFLEHECAFGVRVGFAFGVALQAGIAGAIVGVLWALALSLSLIFGAILGACINAVFWVLNCLAATASGRITPKEAVLVMTAAMTVLCSLLIIVALVVWVIRLLL